MKYKIKRKYEIINVKVEVDQQKMVILNDNDYGNPYDKSNVNKTKIKEKIMKIIKILLIYVVMKMIETTTTIQIISVIIIINNINL